MKFSIRTKFTLGMVFMFIIILVLLGFSAWSLLRLSKKTNAILSENQVSVVYARNMTENLINLNQELSNSFVANRAIDTVFIKNEFNEFDKSIHLELNNITETGEDKLATSLKNGIYEYQEMYSQLVRSPKQVELILLLQKKFQMLYQQLAILSQMNENAIEVKTNVAKDSVKAALTQLSVIGSFCFLIAFSFIYSFASYFNERFSQLYNGIKEIVSSNYGQRLYFDGTDEFFEISLLFNQMAEKLDGTRTKLSVPLLSESEEISEDIQELKSVLSRMKNIKSQAEEVISRIENKQ